MTKTTTLLLETRGGRCDVRWQETFRHIHKELLATHGVPSLGNQRDPAKEILYIVLSAKTTDALYRRAYKSLWSRFDSIAALSEANVSDIEACVECAGFGRKRAQQIKTICNRLVEDFGRSSSRYLRRMSAKEVYSYLVGLPGVGPKSAFCVMMCSLEHDVFPVDVNVYRVARRLGAIQPGLKHYEAQQKLPHRVPDGLAKELHVGLVVHGREVCKPRKPLCNQCVIRVHCRYGNTGNKN